MSAQMSPQSPWLLPGALVVLNDTSIVPIPSFIVFQYNPATLTRSLDPYEPPLTDAGERTGAAARAQPGPPTENISLSLELDATDYLEDPGNHPVGSIFGVSSPIASMEKIMYPKGAILEALLGAIGSLLGIGASSTPVPRSEVPVVLFFWGPSRIVPVRVTNITFDEQGHSPVLYPIHVTARLSMKVLPPSNFRHADRGTSLAEKLAIAAYEWTALNRDLLSVAGLVDTIAGIIPD